MWWFVVLWYGSFELVSVWYCWVEWQLWRDTLSHWCNVFFLFLSNRHRVDQHDNRGDRHHLLLHWQVWKETQTKWKTEEANHTDIFRWVCFHVVRNETGSCEMCTSVWVFVFLIIWLNVWSCEWQTPDGLSVSWMTLVWLYPSDQWNVVIVVTGEWSVLSMHQFPLWVSWLMPDSIECCVWCMNVMICCVMIWVIWTGECVILLSRVTIVTGHVVTLMQCLLPLPV